MAGPAPGARRAAARRRRRPGPAGPSCTCTATAELARHLARRAGQRAAAGLRPGPRSWSRRRTGSWPARNRRWSAAVSGGAARPAVHAAAGLRARRRRPADPGAERRDAGPPGADRPVRRGLVPGRGHAGRARHDARAPCSAPTAAGHVTEAALGTPLAALLPGWPAAGPHGVQAVLCGGYHGTWLAPGQAAGLTLANASLRPAGAVRRRGRAGRAAGQPLRPGRDRPGGPLPGAGVGRAVRPVLQRPAAHRRRAGRAGRARPAPRQPWPTCSAGPGWSTAAGACHHPDGFVRFVAQRAGACSAAELARHARGQCRATERPPVPAGAGRGRYRGRLELSMSQSMQRSTRSPAPATACAPSCCPSWSPWTSGATRCWPTRRCRRRCAARRGARCGTARRWPSCFPRPDRRR